MNLGEYVICLDNLISGNFNNVKKWADYPNFLFLEHDIVNAIDLKVDRIWHFSCPASPAKYQADPIKTLNVCFNGTYNLLELAKNNNAKLFRNSKQNEEKYPSNKKKFPQRNYRNYKK